MIPTYRGCWLVNVSGTAPVAWFAATSAADTDCPSPCARTLRNWPKMGAVMGGGVGSLAPIGSCAAAGDALASSALATRAPIPLRTGRHDADCQRAARR